MEFFSMGPQLLSPVYIYILYLKGESVAGSEKPSPLSGVLSAMSEILTFPNRHFFKHLLLCSLLRTESIPSPFASPRISPKDPV